MSDVVYDAGGRVVASKASAADAGQNAGWVCATYDARGRVLSTAYPDGRSVAYNYAVGNNPLVSSVADSVGGTVTTTVDLLGRVASHADSWGDTTTSTYDQAGRRVRTDGP